MDLAQSTRRPARARASSAGLQDSALRNHSQARPAEDARDPRLPPTPEMLAAVRRRDRRYEGVFVFAVRTTGVCCRPGCASRAPRAENVRFFADLEVAAAAGFRACRRCRPELAPSAEPDWMSSLRAAVERDPAQRWDDARLRGLGLEPATVRRAFQRRQGITFQAWRRSQALGRAQAELRGGANLTSAALAAGFESPGGFREAYARWFGRAPRRGGERPRCVTRGLDSPLGPLWIGATERGVCWLEFADRPSLADQARALARHLDVDAAPGNHPHLDRLARELEQYFSGIRRAFEVPLHLAGSPFQVQVWNELLRIPHGETRSYAELARSIGRPSAQRAVALANARNRISILVPCHRVVGADGRLTGYGGRLWRKRRLLELECGQH